jgi:hypothetical protein
MPNIPNIRSIEHHGDVNALPFSPHVDGRALVKNVAESISVPFGARYVLFSSTGDFYAKVDGTAAVATDVSGTASELNPTLRRLALDQATIGVIAPTNIKMTLTWYK